MVSIIKDKWINWPLFIAKDYCSFHLYFSMKSPFYVTKSELLLIIRALLIRIRGVFFLILIESMSKK